MVLCAERELARSVANSLQMTQEFGLLPNLVFAETYLGCVLLLGDKFQNVRNVEEVLTPDVELCKSCLGAGLDPRCTIRTRMIPQLEKLAGYVPEAL